MRTTTLKIYKHNKLIRAKYPTLSVYEQLILLSAISSTDPRKLTAETPVTIHASKILALTDSQSKNAYSHLKKAVDRLYSRSMTIENPDPDEPNLKTTKTRWVSSIDYFDNEGYIKIYFAPKIIPYIARLKNNFTSYRLTDIAKFKCCHSFRLFESLMQWKGRGEVEISVEDLRADWEMENKYTSIRDFKKYVIDPSVKDINDYSDFWVKYSAQKAGRRIVAFRFEFGLKRKGAKGLADKKSAGKHLNRIGDILTKV